ncbi:hypothetical protein [Bifidobacterium sp. ESL0704]|uniref:hypothetical protein n=1 Tax=Bifidobacterium sp. ESL0704 TaxID=2983219 RepID=UPI0023F6FF27|nr:hypothetical protein [Bifidobacterium sp. ESL0704]WEV52769.1 hypothetical protein OZX64_07895 [Bifidobacterium sp. ESL0704]
MFGDKTRTAVYVLGLALSVIAVIVTLKDDSTAAITASGGILMGGFGVAYNPVSVSRRRG